jgi:hypothetical protein
MNTDETLRQDTPSWQRGMRARLVFSQAAIDSLRASGLRNATRNGFVGPTSVRRANMGVASYCAASSATFSMAPNSARCAMRSER